MLAIADLAAIRSTTFQPDRRMNSFRSFLLLLAAAFVLTACVKDPTSPWEITIQFERVATILDRVKIATRLESDGEEASVLLNVECEEETRTVALPQHIVSPEICGLNFQFTEFSYRGTETTGAQLTVTWGDDAPSEGDRTEPSDEGSAEPAAE